MAEKTVRARLLALRTVLVSGNHVFSTDEAVSASAEIAITVSEIMGRAMHENSVEELLSRPRRRA